MLLLHFKEPAAPGRQKICTHMCNARRDGCTFDLYLDPWNSVLFCHRNNPDFLLDDRVRKDCLFDKLISSQLICGFGLPANISGFDRAMRQGRPYLYDELFKPKKPQVMTGECFLVSYILCHHNSLLSPRHCYRGLYDFCSWRPVLVW